MLKALYSLIIALPEILRLLDTLQKREQAKADSTKLKEDLKKIDQAFKENDAQALNDAFNS